MKAKKKKEKFSKAKFIHAIKRDKQLWVISILAMLWAVVFCYIPSLGNIIAFFDYYPGQNLFETEFIGLGHLEYFFSLPDVGRVFRNTLVISGLSMTIGFAVPVIFALLLNELANPLFKKVVQTISYLPYFISWVVVASILLTLLGTTGNINDILISMGVLDTPVAFLNQPKYFWGILTTANIWKGMGWSAIIYISAIAGVDQELYQAGAVDGLGRFGKVWHITIPSIAPTVILLFIMGIGGILNAGFEEQLLIGTPLTKTVYENIDTYVYTYGVLNGKYSFSTAVGLFKTVIGFCLVMIANKISAKVTEMRLF